MKPFSYYKPVSVAQAVTLLSKHQQRASVLAGGSDMLGMMKDRVEGPKLKLPGHVVDIKGIKELNYIREDKDGLKIGAGTPVADIVASELIAKKYPLLHQAASQVAVPQIRNVGTLGGNLCQRPRCWYFRGASFPDCYRKGGNHCYAVGGENRYHAVMGGSKCFMVHPSDLAPALLAMNANVEIASAKGPRIVAMDKFYVGPDKKVTAETVLEPQELVVAVTVPPASNARGVYIKLKERQAFDFALVSVAVNVTMKGNVVEQARIAFGGLAPFPMRAAKAEAALKGKSLSAAMAAACKAATEGAHPLPQNGYKIAAAQGILQEALTQIG
ncbi:MAG TPA: xanthine dehydrogenase family protein subunit M [Burkholderiales bacterium]|nr:xanthine dehydrogenase family protein subunit M [Burkholderiales bacterium]